MYDHSNSESDGESMGHSHSGSDSSGKSSASASSANSKKTSVTSEPKLKCSGCGKEFLRSETKNMPFCSRRCQQIDLGMWLTEGYGFPYEGDSTARRYERNEVPDEN